MSQEKKLQIRNSTAEFLIFTRQAGEAGIEAWRQRNAGDGLPRPLYLRGVNITLPNGARRTVD